MPDHACRTIVVVPGPEGGWLPHEGVGFVDLRMLEWADLSRVANNVCFGNPSAWRGHWRRQRAFHLCDPFQLGDHGCYRKQATYRRKNGCPGDLKSRVNYLQDVSLVFHIFLGGCGCLGT
jgi:hypothetical protein